MFIYVIMLILAAMIWGTGYVAVKFAIEAGYQPFFISTIRFFIAGSILMFAQRKNFKHTTRVAYKSGMILGLFLFMGFGFQTMSLKYTTASKNAFITAIYVVIVPFLFWIMYKKRPTVAQFIAVFVSLLGARFLNGNLNGGMNFGDILTLIGALFFAAHMVFLGIYAARHNPVMLTFLQTAMSGIIALIFALIFEPFPTFNLKGILAIIYLGIFSSCVAFTLQTVAQKHIPQITASLILSLEAVFGSLFSVLILKEQVDSLFILGGILICSAILLAEIKFNFPKGKHSLQ